ncbi:ABC-2 type transporter [Ferrimonas balearica DSM 9799]|uniref:Transport permease protein n=1 Tax=Ferrimonas balearica (strain DSM 9799 / CCM 4581 / KCTC 23876 / PAT) TaxID=550540 RepID=E1SP16_FERBD|nr:ABC transporter permease [Ferrimonas balearica]ADN74665.1 ABC-2 type transporter [Ferrimonas balearica DSM 9799]
MNTTNTLIRPPKRSHWQITCDVVFALIIRELKTRFGANRLGYFWALAEPIAQAGIMVLIFTLLGRNSISGVPVALFMLVAILPFKFFSKLVPQLTAAVEANKGLLSYRQVTAADPILSRVIIETVTFLVVYLLLMATLAWLNFSVVPENLLALLGVSALVLMLALGLGLMLCSAVTYWKDTGKVVAMVMQPMFFISGIFFCATMIPQQYWYLFSWNPLFHVTELSRDAYFSAYTTPVGSWEYLGLWAFSCFTLGLMTFRVCQQRFITS